MARITLTTHWKFLRLARVVGSRVLARGILETLWEPCWLARDAYCGTSDDIEALCDWRGEPGALTQALLMRGAKSAGFIEPYQGRIPDNTPHYQVHDFLDHCPEYVRSRVVVRVCIVCGDDYTSSAPKSQVCSPRCRQRLRRQRSREACTPPIVTFDDRVRDTNVTEGSDPINETGVGHADVTSGHAMSRTYINKTKLSTRTTPGVPDVACAAALHADAPPADETPVDRVGSDLAPVDPTPTVPAPRRRTRAPDPTDTSPVVLTFPVTGVGGPLWPLHASRVERWSALYPSLDVLAEARQCLAWVEADLTRRKTAGGMAKCLVSWLNRSVDSPRRGPTLITGSLKTAGNKAAIESFLRRHDALD